ncbi:MAG TPA: HlyD family efflux transporter periplasmic adaptor subunit [Polyangiaceae bacterium]|nr:HlyD family efflux transporter periplasmic adaptor subunit [Polyangiaceae bacterium]
MIHFSRTRHFVRHQRFGEHAGIIVALMVLLGGWCIWLTRGSVTLYVVSRSARLEVEQLPVQVQAEVDGIVSAANVYLGRAVSKGDVLLKLDTTEHELRRAELEVGIRTSMASLEALRAELAAERHVRGAVASMAEQASLSAAARISLDEKALVFKERELEMDERLREASVVSNIEALHTAADTETQRARVVATSAQATLDTLASKMNVRERDARLASVGSRIAEAEAQLAQMKAQLDTLNFEIRRRTVLAPVSGVLADVMSIGAGMSVTREQRLVTIVNEGPLRVVGLFAPEQSNGRVQPGQQATLRFDSFPWSQFGTVKAITSAVAGEPRDGNMRVELRILAQNPAITLQHGMTAACEVEVESTTPLRLLLRSLSEIVTREPAAPQARVLP